MKVKCIHNTGKVFELYKIIPDGYSLRTQFSIVEEEEYLVLGTYYESDFLNYLIESNEVVFLYPAILFKIIDSQLNSNWHINVINNKEIGTVIKTGYSEFCFNENHYMGLVEQEERELSLFRKRKKDMDNHHRMLRKLDPT